MERVAQHKANEAWFDAVHAKLNDGGVWAGDHATMFKHGALWYATLPNYNYMKMITTSDWMKKVVLMADATGTMSDRDLFNAVISAPAIPVPEEVPCSLCFMPCGDSKDKIDDELVCQDCWDKEQAELDEEECECGECSRCVADDTCAAQCGDKGTITVVGKDGTTSLVCKDCCAWFKKQNS